MELDNDNDTIVKTNDEQIMNQDDTSATVNEETELEEVLTSSLHLRGVDTLNTAQIKQYLDMHIRPGFCFENRHRFAYLDFKINWINDSELCVVFNYKQKPESKVDSNTDVFSELKGDEADLDIKMEDIKELKYDSSKGALDAIMLLTDFDNIRKEHEEFAQLSLRDQFAAVDQAPKLEERKCWDLVLDDGNRVVKTKAAKVFYKTFRKVVLGEDDENEEDSDHLEENSTEEFPEDFKVIQLEVRFATNKDRKVKNAREYSRYYLINGEPDLSERLPPAEEKTHPSYRNRFKKDLITGEELETTGLFGYDQDLNPEDVVVETERRKNNYRRNDRWKNDYYFDDREYNYRNRWDGHGRGRGRGGRRGGISKRPKPNNNRRNVRGDSTALPDLFPDFGKK
ncbi:hypothetical protein CANINC_001575 [Pichia inconspicua]|uniref:Uncharacterized protein n=1 Tax=Pichia inconspicua TaxID=52247 RepID=A0A4T0X3A7_9ASCO|nr:hypothetical protein CANINC_001575 [[Candida] inconspicua]